MLRSFLPVSSLFLLACGNAPTTPRAGEGAPAEPVKAAAAPSDAKSADAAAPSQGEPTAAEAKTLRGTLRFKELPATKSVEAYDGVEFFLDGADGDTQNLTESAAVTREQLLALDGKAVEVEGTWVPPQAPSDPMGAVPVQGDGSPQPRSGRWSVTAIREAAP